MKRFFAAVLILALLMPMAGTAFAGVDWDGDPSFDVDGVRVHISFNIDNGAFVRAGGHVALLVEAPKIRQLGKGPRFVSSEARSGVDVEGLLQLTATLSGAPVPEGFTVRVRVPNRGVDMLFDASSGLPLVVTLP